jgi:hypothetical protein
LVEEAVEVPVEVLMVREVAEVAEAPQHIKILLL